MDTVLALKEITVLACVCITHHMQILMLGSLQTVILTTALKGGSIIPILQRRSPGFRKLKWFAQDPPAGNWGPQDSLQPICLAADCWVRSACLSAPDHMVVSS